jgi:PBP1b-binding outer membrane lipoprotein LpoB
MTSLPLLLSDNTKKTPAQPDVPPVKPLPQKCVSLVEKTDLVLHSVYVMMDSMKMESNVPHVEWNVLPVTTLIPVSLVLVTELNQKKVVHVHIIITILVKNSVHHVVMNVLNVI